MRIPIRNARLRTPLLALSVLSWVLSAQGSDPSVQGSSSHTGGRPTLRPRFERVFTVSRAPGNTADFDDLQAPSITPAMAICSSWRRGWRNRGKVSYRDLYTSAPRQVVRGAILELFLESL